MAALDVRWIAATGAVAVCLALPIAHAEKVALRHAGGKYLKVAPDGRLRAEKSFPTAEEFFELVPRDGGKIALKGSNGRFLVPDAMRGRELIAAGPSAGPADRETFLVVPVEGNRVAMKPLGSEGFVRFGEVGGEGREVRGEGRGTRDEKSEPTGAGPAQKPRPQETVEIFQAVEVPATIRSALADLVRRLAAEELADKRYDQVRSRKRQQSLDFWVPTLRDPARVRSVRVLSLVEEYRVQARLDGPLELEILRMLYLKGYQDRKLGVLMFVVQSRLPVRGQVSYKVPGALSASTGYHATAALRLVGEIQARKSGKELSLGSPELREIHVGLSRLDLSNDLLHAAREPIEDLINEELRTSEEKIRQQANRSLAKAFQARQLQHPLLQYLGLP